ncbi:hypothetical protein DWB64_02745 [Fusibacter sp. A1]|nr:hypothetical protein DWB64_02745 [Fusibacter sp. A1]
MQILFGIRHLITNLSAFVFTLFSYFLIAIIDKKIDLKKKLLSRYKRSNVILVSLLVLILVNLIVKSYIDTIIAKNMLSGIVYALFVYYGLLGVKKRSIK